MSETELRQLGADEKTREYRFYEMWETLIVENEAIEGADDSHLRTRGQKLLSRIGTLHSQINNGGIEQFFWNCPSMIFDVLDDFELLAAGELVDSYTKILEALIGKKDVWIELKEAWNRGGSEPDFQTFIESRELLDVDWFNSAFFGDWDNGRQVERGLGDGLVELTIKYVLDHPDEFIRRES